MGKTAGVIYKIHGSSGTPSHPPRKQSEICWVFIAASPGGIRSRCVRGFFFFKQPAEEFLYVFLPVRGQKSEACFAQIA